VAYELDQLRETFAGVAEILRKYRDLSIPDLITSSARCIKGVCTAAGKDGALAACLETIRQEILNSARLWLSVRD
jgi:hypothetical protein